MSAAAHDVDVVKVPEEQFLQVLLRDYGDRFDNEQALDLLIRYLELKILRLELEAGKYDGYFVELIEQHATELKRLGLQRSDAWHDLYFAAVGAIDSYDSSFPRPFSSWLYDALQNGMTALIGRERNRVYGARKGKRFAFTEALPSYEINPSANLQIEEQLRVLSEQSRDCLHKLLRFDDQHALLEAFKTKTGKQSKHWLGNLAKLTGIPKPQIESAFSELDRRRVA